MTKRKDEHDILMLDVKKLKEQQRSIKEQIVCGAALGHDFVFNHTSCFGKRIVCVCQNCGLAVGRGLEDIPAKQRAALQELGIIKVEAKK